MNCKRGACMDQSLYFFFKRFILGIMDIDKDSPGHHIAPSIAETYSIVFLYCFPQDHWNSLSPTVVAA